MAASSAGKNNFAREQLLKYGWIEGKGLGKHEDGISKPLKPRLKFNKAGVGCDPGAEYTNTWWEHVFNSAAAKITVDTLKGFDQVSVKSTTNCDILNGPNTKRNNKYTNFCQSSLVDGDVSNRSENLGEIARVSDEEMFRKCEGMTAHRAARHGLKMNGKLRRLELQEKLASSGNNGELETSVGRKRKNHTHSVS